jgi:hypothetical protein
MKTNKIVQTIGGVAKEETLFTLTTHIMPNTFVLENDEPYPFYHGINLPTEPKPVSVFLMTKDKLSTERILRINNSIRKYFDQPFDAVPGIICIHNETLPCIRLRGLDNYEIIGELQKHFFSEGIRFMKKRNIRALAVIQLKKLYNIEEIEDGIFCDVDDPSMFYIKIPKQLSWRMFTQVTARVRNNVEKEDANFDAALAAIYTKDILDVARIYAREMNVNRLKLIKLKYEEIIYSLD